MIGVSITSCEGSDPARGLVVRDSAGVRIVESSSRTWSAEEAWRIEERPLLDLASAGVGDAHTFSQVTDAARLPNGDIVVATRTDLRFFDSSGEHLVTTGRPGRGPGEFTGLGRIEFLTPDSLVAFDYWRPRATILNPDRTVARVVRFDMPVRRAAVVGNVMVVMSASPGVNWEELPLGLNRVPLPLLAFSSGGLLLDTIGLAAGWEGFTRSVDGGVGIEDALFGRDSHISGHGGRLFLGDAVAMEYRVLSSDGTLERVVRAAYDVSLTPALWSAERSAQLGPDPSPGLRRVFEEMGMPEARPAYQNLEVDPTGAVWLQEARGEGVTRTTDEAIPWEVFGPDGAWLGQVMAPGRFTVVEIGIDYVLGVLRDDFDVERVQILRLRR